MVFSEARTDDAPKNYSHRFAGCLNAACGMLWSSAYVLYVRQAHKDSSYGMPVFALCLNLAWEFVHTFVYPLHGIGRYIHFPWVFLDILLLVQTLKHGPEQWSHSSPIMAENFYVVVIICLFLALVAQWLFTHEFSKSNSCFWSAYLCQNILSWGSVWQLIARGHPSGHSIPIWWCRFLGSLAANLRYLYRVRAWPEKYAFLSSPLALWMLWAPCAADLLYPLAFQLVSRQPK